ncbi:MAG: aspartate/glutamate racemase family protein [Pseudomonadota bacterium]
MPERSIALINPNTNPQTTETMVRIAQDAVRRLAPATLIRIAEHTARSGPKMIVDMEELEHARSTVASIVHELADQRNQKPDAVIVSAFGDPGLEVAETCFPARAFGIGAESMRTASRGGRRFAVATTTPGLVQGIDRIAEQLGLADKYCGTFVTQTDPSALAAEPLRQRDELADTIDMAVDVGGAEAVIIGGGPLAASARELSSIMTVPLVQPIPEAVRSAVASLI